MLYFTQFERRAGRFPGRRFIMDKAHIRLLRALGACSDAIVFAEKYPSLKAAWKACQRGDWLCWFAGRVVNPEWGTPEHRKIVGVTCRCARLVEKHWTDKRSGEAVTLAERYASGEQIAQSDLRAAGAAAWAAAWDAAGAAALKTCADIVRKSYPLPPKKS
jgi:hypothetical protein